MLNSIRALIVDDHSLFRSAIVHAVNTAPDIKVVGEAASGVEALALAQELLPDIMLLDISMPGWNGLVTAEKITTACPAVKIIIVTASEDTDTLLKAFKLGARAYVLKGILGPELIHVMRATANGEVYVSPSLAAEMLVSLTQKPAPDPLQELTEREQAILRLIGDGLTNREIGEQLFLSEKTIKHYVTNILQKLQVRSRVEAALIASKGVHYKKMGRR